MSKGITRERTGRLLQELFRVLIENRDGIKAQTVIDVVASRIPLTEHEQGEYEGGVRRFDKILRFATVDAVKAGWMRKEKGVWFITEAGETALKMLPDGEKFYQEASRLYRKWRQSKESELAADFPEEAVQQAEAQITFEQADEQARKEIESFLEVINPYDLQDLVAALLEAMGYHVAWVAPPGKDGGVDILAWPDPLGTRAPRIKVQVKRRKDSIRVDELRAFLSLVNEDDVGLFVTTGDFTKDAVELARTQEKRKITLIAGERLVELWIEYNDKIEKDKLGLLPLRPIYFLAPEFP